MLKSRNVAQAEIGDEQHQAVTFQATVQSGVVDLENFEEWLPDEETLHLDLMTMAGMIRFSVDSAFPTKLASRARVRLKLEVTPVFER